MPCKHCHKPKDPAEATRYPDLPLCLRCMAQHQGACPRFPRDQFKVGTRLSDLKGHSASDWLQANGLKITA